MCARVASVNYFAYLSIFLGALPFQIAWQGQPEQTAGGLFGWWPFSQAFQDYIHVALVKKGGQSRWNGLLLDQHIPSAAWE